MPPARPPKTVTICVDTNAGEQRVFDALRDCIGDCDPSTDSTAPQLRRRRLDIGDVEVCAESVKVVIERKTEADLRSSFADGRYREQKSRILAHCKGEGSLAVYVIEVGERLPQWWVHAGFDLASAGAVLNTSLRDRVPVLFSKDQLHTGDIVLRIAKAAQLGKLLPTPLDEHAMLESLPTSKRSKVSDAKALAVQMLRQTPGVSAKAASAVLARFPSLLSVLSATEEELADVKVGTRRLGPVCARRILELGRS